MKPGARLKFSMIPKVGGEVESVLLYSPLMNTVRLVDRNGHVLILADDGTWMKSLYSAYDQNRALRSILVLEKRQEVVEVIK